MVAFIRLAVSHSTAGGMVRSFEATLYLYGLETSSCGADLVVEASHCERCLHGVENRGFRRGEVLGEVLPYAREVSATIRSPYDLISAAPGAGV